MIRSLRSLEKMSKARSPRGVCSTTIGTRAIGLLLIITSPARLLTNRRLTDQEVQGHPFTQTLPERFEIAAFLHHTPHSRRGPLHHLGEPPDLGLDVVVGRGQALAVG